ARHLPLARRGEGVRELSRRSGVSSTQISEIERNLTAPTVPTLMKIISALETDTSIFFERKNIKRITVSRRDERQEIIDRKNSVFIQSLTKGITDTRLKVILAHPPPGAENIKGGYQHPGEEFIYVIKGKIQVTIEDKSYILNEGDSIHFHSELRHIIKNITDGEVEALAVITPPNY
ncbi:MAG: helix-turn-helix domain-containing protein, partial [bacterium]